MITTFRPAAAVPAQPLPSGLMRVRFLLYLALALAAFAVLQVGRPRAGKPNPDTGAATVAGTDHDRPLALPER